MIRKQKIQLFKQNNIFMLFLIIKEYYNYIAQSNPANKSSSFSSALYFNQ